MIYLLLYIVYLLVIGLILVNIILPWIPQARSHPLGRLLYRVSDPLLAPFRAIVPPIKLGYGASLDLSPILCYVVLRLVFLFLARLLPQP